MTLKRLYKSFIAVLLLAAMPAVAVLPESTYHSGITQSWYTAADGAEYHLRIEYAVYDTQDDGFGALGLENPGGGKFLYAYQLTCKEAVKDGVDIALEYFGLDDTSNIAGIGYDSASAGIAPSVSFQDAINSRSVWAFDDGDLVADAVSAVLLLSSDNDYVEKQVKLTPPEGDGGIIGPGGEGNGSVPEPATMLLLAAGSIAVLKRKKS